MFYIVPLSNPPTHLPSLNSSSDPKPPLTFPLQQIRFLGDPTASFTSALDLTFDGTAIFGGPRSKRYALQIEDGKVKALHVEPDNTGLDGMLIPFHNPFLFSSPPFNIVHPIPWYLHI